MMCTMRLGRRSLVALTLVFAPALAGCELLDLRGGSTVEDAFEYLPADTLSVQFADRGAMAERLGVDDIDPRDVSRDDVDRYIEKLGDEDGTAVAATALAPYLHDLQGAPLNEFDIEWEAFATWGDADDDSHRGATVWKVGDDLDFQALAEDLEDKGYDEGGAGDLPIYSITQAGVDVDTGTVGGVYPAPLMLNVLLDEDEQLVAAAVSTDALGDIADVVTDDADSLADDGGMDDLLDAADGDPELAALTAGGPTLCNGNRNGGPLPERLPDGYADLGRPDARALFVAGEDAKALLVLHYGSEDDAEADLDAREALVAEGVDIQTRESFDDLGHFSLEQDGDLVLIEEDFDGGPAQAVRAERSGSGPGVCVQEAD